MIFIFFVSRHNEILITDFETPNVESDSDFPLIFPILDTLQRLIIFPAWSKNLVIDFFFLNLN